MIHIKPRPEPVHFDKDVRQKGLAFLSAANVSLDSIPPENFQFNPFWRDALDDLYKEYNGICAYLAVFFERATGTASADHYLAKAKSQAGLAYEWHNYRLSCIGTNRKKNIQEVLDPVTVEDDWFFLDTITGTVFPNPLLPKSRIESIHLTIQKLGLNDGAVKEMRSRHWLNYIQEGYPDHYLKTQSPFVWKEAARQGLLRSFTGK